jgi:hypothetical protein
VLLGITPGRRGILYHRLFSSQAPGFVSEPAEVQEALETVSQSLTPFKDSKTVTWITDRGFDDVAVWRTIWQQHEHVVSRIYHKERLVTLPDQQGNWRQGSVGQAQEQVRPLARVETTLEVQRGQQRHPKRQPVQVDIAACPLRLTYSTGVRRQEPGEVVTKELWLGPRAGARHDASPLAPAHRLARARRAERCTHLHHVSRTLGRRG